MEQGKDTTEAPQRQRRGCLFYGLVTAGALLLLLLLGTFLTIRYATNLVARYTDEKPAPLPKVQMAQAEIDRLQRRVDVFREKVQQKQKTEPLVLTASDINALIATDPDLSPWREKIYVTIEAAQLKAQVSLPLDDLGLPKLRGRWLNATGTVAVIFRDSVLRVLPQSLDVKGKPLLAEK
jgi:hypothetical protein